MSDIEFTVTVKKKKKEELGNNGNMDSLVAQTEKKSHSYWPLISFKRKQKLKESYTGFIEEFSLLVG